jgi:DNA-binding NtrC family response regulator
VALAEQCWLGPGDVFPDLSRQSSDVPDLPTLGTLAEARAVAERQQIERALGRTEGHLNKAADLLGISRTTLWEKMRKLGLSQE